MTPAPRWPLLIAVAASAAAYAPITANYFHSDDFLILQGLVNRPFLRFVLEPGAGHVYVGRNLLYWMFWSAFGPEPAYHLAAVLLTHLLNVALLYGVVRRLTGSARLACFGATLWGIAPAHEGSLGWYAVYGHVLVATLLLVVLGGMARRAAAPAPLAVPQLSGWCGLLLLACLTFGVGLGIALVFPLGVLLVFPGERITPGARWLVLALPVVVLGTYWGIHRLYGVLYDVPLEGGLVMMLAMLSQWQAAAAMLGQLLAAAVVALVGGVWLPLAAFPGPLAYAVTGLFLALVAGGLVGAPAATRRLVAAYALMTFGVYAVVAAGRGPLLAMLASVPAYGAGVTRYHYVGSLLLGLVLCLVLGRVGGVLRVGDGTSTALLLAWLAGTAVLAARGGWQIEHHALDRTATANIVGEIHDAIDTVPPGGTVVIANRRFWPINVPDFAGWAALFTIFFPDDHGRRVYFVERDPKLHALAPPGSRLAAVLVPRAP